MINIAYLCAVLAADIPCTPYDDLTACESARVGLSAALVERSECADMEILDPRPAPHVAPLPRARPIRGTPA